jgi:hypothetical protein
MAGYRRVDGLEAAALLAELYRSVRLFVNFFQPSFKLIGKQRDGARVRKSYSAPTTPHQRLAADARTCDAVRARLQEIFISLDPVALLRDRSGDRTAEWFKAEPWRTGAELLTTASGPKQLNVPSTHELHSCLGSSEGGSRSSNGPNCTGWTVKRIAKAQTPRSAPRHAEHGRRKLSGVRELNCGIGSPV